MGGHEDVDAVYIKRLEQERDRLDAANVAKMQDIDDLKKELDQARASLKEEAALRESDNKILNDLGMEWKRRAEENEKLLAEYADEKNWRNGNEWIAPGHGPDKARAHLEAAKRGE